MIVLIREEYGRAYWVAELTQTEWDELARRWQTMRGLSCLVPVPLIVPQARPLDLDNRDWLTALPAEKIRHCHIHEWHDSGLEGVRYAIPEPEMDELDWPLFVLDGVTYTVDDMDRSGVSPT